MDPAQAFLMGGRKIPSAFQRYQRNTPLPVGTTIRGQVESWEYVQQRDYDDDTKLKFWDDGSPMMQLVIVLVNTGLSEERYRNQETGEADDGDRKLYVKGELQKALRKAITAAGVPFIERGGWITTQITGEGVASNPKYNPPTLYTCHYEPAAQNFLSTPTPDETPAVAVGGFATGANAIQPPVVQPSNGFPGSPGVQSYLPAADPLAAAQAAVQQAMPAQVIQQAAPPVVPPVVPQPAIQPAVPAGLDPTVAAALAALPPEQLAALRAQMGGGQ